MKTTEHRALPSLETLQKLFSYDPLTGILRYKKNGKAVSQRHIYSKVKVEGHAYDAARVMWKMNTGNDPAELVIDHINGNRCDNRAINHRLCTRKQNLQNRKKGKSNTSGYKGVTTTQKGKFIAQCSGKYIGSFDDAWSASIAYRETAVKLHGEFYRYE